MPLKLAPRGHAVLRMHDDAKNLFADSTVPCFFWWVAFSHCYNYTHITITYVMSCSWRRPTFTPDGALLILPTGIFRSTPSTNASSSGKKSSQSFCTYIISRNNLTTPIICLVGLEEPSIAVRCSPALYKMVEYKDDIEAANNNSGKNLLNGKYRYR